MRIQFMTGDVRLIRFPIERRLAPSEEMLHDISPDPREICQLVEAFHLEPLELGIQDRAGEEMVRYLAQFSDGDHRRGAALAALKDELLREAVAVCADAAQASDLAGEAAQKLHDASMVGGSYLRVFQERSARLTLAGAKAMVRAHIAGERALGALRAIRLAEEGEGWTEFNANDVMEELMRVHQAARCWSDTGAASAPRGAGVSTLMRTRGRRSTRWRSWHNGSSAGGIGLDRRQSRSR